MNKSTGNVSDLEDRDPNVLSEHLKVSWEDVIGEPESIRSPECAWRVSNQCFNFSKNCCYTFLAVIFAPVFAFILGCTFACTAFEHIWCITPGLRLWKIIFAAVRKFLGYCVAGVVIPIASGFGAFWSQIRVKIQKAPETSSDKDEDVLML